MKNFLKNNLIIFLLSLIFFIVLFDEHIFTAPLKKGVYKIINHKTNQTEMLVDENGKILLKSKMPESTIGVIEDILTGDDKLLYKNYSKLFEKSNDHYADDSYYDENYGWSRTYDGEIPENIEYFDLTGKKLDFNKKVLGVINDTVIFDDGNCYNLLLNAKLKLNELINDNKIYKLYLFDDYLLFTSGVKIFIYDKKLNFKKIIEGYNIYSSIYEQDKYVIISRTVNDFIFDNVIDNNLNLVFEKDMHISRNGYSVVSFKEEDSNGDIIISGEYDVIKKQYKENISNSKKIEFNNDNSNLTSTIYDNDKNVIINDIEIKDVKGFLINNKKYYYIWTTNAMSYIYNDSGDRVKILEKNGFQWNLFFSDDDYFMFLDGVGYAENLYVYDKNFILKQKIKISEKANIQKMFDDKYYMVNTNTQTKPILIFDKEFNQIYETNDKTVKFKKLLNKYYYENGENSRIIDENFKSVINFNSNVFDIKTVKVRDKIFIIVGYYNNKKDVFDTNFKKITSLVSSSFHSFNTYLTNGIDLKLDENYNYIISEQYVNDESLITIFDLNFKEITKLDVLHDFDGYENVYDFNYSDSRYISKMVGDYFVIRQDSNYSLYKVGYGFVLKNFYYIGDLNNDHFTYVNGFNYGFMDYDLNVLSKYSVFDSFDEDYNRYYYFW